MAAEIAFAPPRVDEISDPRWFPHDYDARRREIVLRYAERDYWAERRFLDSRHVGAALPTHRLAAHRVAGAELDVWQNGDNRLYAVQDEDAPDDHLRGRFQADAEGRFAFRAVGVRPNYYAEDQEDAIVMLLDLG